MIIRFIICLEPTPFPTNNALVWLGATLVHWTVWSSKIDYLVCSVHETMIWIVIVTGNLTAHLIAFG